DDGARPITTVRSSTIGMIGSAPDADPLTFPLNTPVLIAGSRTLAAKLGETGTLPQALDSIFDQIGAVVIVVRINEEIAAPATLA
ncbi:phage tail protein, partial [bacterium LRH843]|nr:phage tail protein [bacterium LRH843]